MQSVSGTRAALSRPVASASATYRSNTFWRLRNAIFSIIPFTFVSHTSCWRLVSCAVAVISMIRASCSSSASVSVVAYCTSSSCSSYTHASCTRAAATALRYCTRS